MESTGEDQQIKATESIMDYLEGGPDFMDELSEDYFESLIERITAVSETQLDIRLWNGLVLRETVERAVR